MHRLPGHAITLLRCDSPLRDRRLWAAVECSKHDMSQSPDAASGTPRLYKPLAKGYIKLLKIQHRDGENAIYRLNTHLQEHALDYDTVSYCWGEGETSATVNCNGFGLLIRNDLFIALQYLVDRSPPLRPLWIDAICLNQEDDDEKAVQVPLMSEVFKNATRTTVWLGVLRAALGIGIELMEALLIILPT